MVSSSRRGVLLACAGAACVAAAGGCARYDSRTGGVAGGPAAAPPSAPPQPASAPATSGAAPDQPAAAPAQPALASTAQVPVGGGTVLASQRIVITQPQAGSFNAFTAVCTHQGCIVATVSGATINCPCHGSKFSITDGSVVNGPASSPLARVNIKVEGTSIVPA